MFLIRLTRHEFWRDLSSQLVRRALPFADVLMPKARMERRMMILNGETVRIPADLSSIPLVEYLRDHLGLFGTKFGCGIGQCGACTVHVNGQAERSCQLTMEDVDGQRVTTIEGLAENGKLHPVQEAWIAERVPQCGYCQPGQIMTAAAFLDEQPYPSEANIREAMDGNLCRCGTYGRIRKAVKRAARGGLR